MALKSCAHQDLVAVCLCNYTSVFQLDQNQPAEKMMVILTEENMHLRQREARLKHGDGGEPWKRGDRVGLRLNDISHYQLGGHPISPNLLPAFQRQENC